MTNSYSWNGATYNGRHGGAFDRGMADAYYRRPREPHYYQNGTKTSPIIKEYQMTEDQISQYHAGYSYQIDQGDFKDWG
tara:strand:- start:137 stop:373 length:237 start_codon:yes stop_codon:yes gene_type:complete